MNVLARQPKHKLGDIQDDRQDGQQGAMEALFILLAERDERRSMVITTSLMPSGRDRTLKDPMTTAAAIDLVAHLSVIPDLMTTATFRPKDAASKKSNREERLQETRAQRRPTIGNSCD